MQVQIDKVLAMAGAPHSSWHEITSSLVPLYRYSKTSWLIGLKDFPTQPPWTSHTFRTGAWKRRYRFEPKDGHVEARHGWICWACQMSKILKPTSNNYWKLRLSKGQPLQVPWFNCRVYPTPVYWTTHATSTATSKTSRAGRELTRSWCGDVHSLLVSPPA